MTGAEIILTVAVILGPTLAVGVSLFMERRRNQRERRMDIFRTLMRTRMGTSKLSFDHVSALAWIIAGECGFGGDTGATVWYKRSVHNVLATTEAPA